MQSDQKKEKKPNTPSSKGRIWKYVLIVFGSVIIPIVSLADSIRDKRSSDKSYRNPFEKFKPYFLWRKFQDKWHIWKQISFILPLSFIWITVISVSATISYVLAIVLGVVLIIAAWAVWKIIKSPIWWD